MGHPSHWVEDSRTVGAIRTRGTAHGVRSLLMLMAHCSLLELLPCDKILFIQADNIQIQVRNKNTKSKQVHTSLRAHIALIRTCRDPSPTTILRSLSYYPHI